MWEVFEALFCKESFSKAIGCSANSQSIHCQLLNKVNSCDYWYGKLEDIIVNMAGFVVGAALAKKLNKI